MFTRRLLTDIGTDSEALMPLSDIQLSFIHILDVVSLDLVSGLDSGFRLGGLPGVLFGVGLTILILTPMLMLRTPIPTDMQIRIMTILLLPILLRISLHIQIPTNTVKKTRLFCEPYLRDLP